MKHSQSKRKLRTIQQGRDQTANLLGIRSALASAEKHLLLAMGDAGIYGREPLGSDIRKALRATEKALARAREESP